MLPSAGDRNCRATRLYVANKASASSPWRSLAVFTTTRPSAAPRGANNRRLLNLRVPETRFGPLERLLAGSSGAYLMRLLAV